MFFLWRNLGEFAIIVKIDFVAYEKILSGQEKAIAYTQMNGV